MDGYGFVKVRGRELSAYGRYRSDENRRGAHLAGHKRGVSLGWSKDSARAHWRKVGRLQFDKLPDDVVFATLTFGACPETAAACNRCLKNFLDALRRRGLVHHFWGIEYQGAPPEAGKRPGRRWLARQAAIAVGLPDPGGVPHFHVLLWFKAAPPDDIRELWLKAAAKYGPSPKGQRIECCVTPLGAAKYKAKHARRTSFNAQREAENAPAHWAENGGLGQVWGSSRKLPLQIERKVITTGEMVERILDEAIKKQVADAYYKAYDLELSKGENIEAAEAAGGGAAFAVWDFVKERRADWWQGFTVWADDIDEMERLVQSVMGGLHWEDPGDGEETERGV